MFSVFLKILHLIFFIVDVICGVIETFKRNLNYINDNYFNNKKNIYYEISKLQKLDKLPVHLTVLLSKEEPSLKDLSNLILWSLITGITFISFYDRNGILKKNEEKFKSEVDRIKQDNNHHLIWHSCQKVKHRNGFSGKKIHVKIFSEVDGRQNIVEVTKQIASNLVNLNDIDIPKIDKQLNEYYEFPDPDMGIYFGKTFFLFGYPPWQLRLTEFFNIKTHYNINYKTFINLIYNYSKCERRVGK